MHCYTNSRDQLCVHICFLDARNGRGLRFGKLGLCDLNFKGLAFDSAGNLPFTFHAPLINPTGGPMITRPKGTHFVMTGG